MKLDFLLKIAKVMPVILFISGALGLFLGRCALLLARFQNSMVNKRLGLSIMMVGLGLFLGLFHAQKFYIIAGWAGAAVGMLLFGWVYSQARAEFPPMSDKDWIIMKKREQNARIEALAAKREAKKQKQQQE